MKNRELYFEDTFTLSEILEKMDFQSDLNKLFDEAKKQPEAQAYLGAQLFLAFGKKWHRAKDEIIRFISDITDEPIDKVKKIKFSELKELLSELVKDEEIQSFIKRVLEGQK